MNIYINLNINKSKLDGLIFHIKEALGKNGEPLKVVKIRTMVKDAHNNLEHLLSENGLCTIGKINNDPRVTPLGKVFRKYWIDELPQLFQVMIGQMSLVGIRPKSSEGWKYLHPKKLKEEALKYKPGFLGVQYAYNTNSYKASILTEFIYLDEKKERPIITDLKFGSMILYNILFKKQRSQ